MAIIESRKPISKVLIFAKQDNPMHNLFASHDAHT